MEIMKAENYAGKALEIGNMVMKRCNELKEKYEEVGDVRGLGSMIGIEFVKTKAGKEPYPEFVSQMIQNALQRGLMLENAGSYGNVIRFLAPLCITKEQLEKGLDIFEEAFKKINRSLQDELLNEVMKLSPRAFEKLALDLMAKMGYGTFENSARTTSVTNDEGIDGVIMEDKLGFDLIYVQAKKWDEDHTVGRPEVQAFVGAIAGKGGKGLFVTTSKFSKQAIEYAAKQHIILIDGEKLTGYMIEYNFGVSEKKIFTIKGIDTDTFNDYVDG